MMKQKKITLMGVYQELQNLKLELALKEAFDDTIDESKIIWVDEELLAEDWLSPEDMEAWKDL